MTQSYVEYLPLFWAQAPYWEGTNGPVLPICATQAYSCNMERNSGGSMTCKDFLFLEPAGVQKQNQLMVLRGGIRAQVCTWHRLLDLVVGAAKTPQTATACKHCSSDSFKDGHDLFSQICYCLSHMQNIVLMYTTCEADRYKCSTNLDRIFRGSLFPPRSCRDPVDSEKSQLMPARCDEQQALCSVGMCENTKTTCRATQQHKKNTHTATRKWKLWAICDSWYF